MGKPYSLDLRKRIVAYVEAGHAARAAGRVFGVSASTATRLLAAWRKAGAVAPRPQRRKAGTAGKLAPQRAFLVKSEASATSSPPKTASTPSLMQDTSQLKCKMR